MSAIKPSDTSETRISTSTTSTSAHTTTTATSTSTSTSSVPIIVITGFLGAGKTTLILDVIKQLHTRDPNYRVAWLKNEFGVNQVDTELARESHVAVREILNGCVCCTLVGQLGEAIKELVTVCKPDRILVETSGSAYPAPVAWEIRRLISSEHIPLHLDAIVCVIDAVNFKGYQDTSYTAKIQAQYTDIIVINKHELVSEAQLDSVMDSVYELNPDTLKVKTNKGHLDASLLCGIDTKLFSTDPEFTSHPHDATCQAHCHHADHDHHQNEVSVVNINTANSFNRSTFISWLDSLSNTTYYRVKGIILFTPDQPSEASSSSSTTETTTPTSTSSPNLINWAFGRYELHPLSDTSTSASTRLTLMGIDIHMNSELARIREVLKVSEREITVVHVPS